MDKQNLTNNETSGTRGEKQLLRADNDTQTGGNFGTTLVNNLGGILGGAAQIVSAANHKETKNYNETVDRKSFSFNNGTTIAAIIGGSVVLAVVAVVLLKKQK